MKSVAAHALVTTLTLFLFVAAAPAKAATYEVDACTTTGPLVGLSGDWSATAAPTDFGLMGDCSATPIALSNSWAHAATPGFQGGLRFTVPKGTSIVAATVQYTLQAYGVLDDWWWNSIETTTLPSGVASLITFCDGRFESCRLGSKTALLKGKPPASSWELIEECSPQSRVACPASTAAMTVSSAHFTIDDSTAPRLASTPQGKLLSGENDVRRGVQTLSFEAADDESGVFRGALEVDGAPVAEANLDDNAGHCRLPFRTAQPCRTHAIGTIQFDSAGVADGTHQALLRVFDATGSNSAVYGPVRFRSANRTVGSLCGNADSAQLRLRVPRRSVRMGQRVMITASVASDSGAELVVLTGRRHLHVTGPLAIRDGRARFAVRPKSDRILRLAIRPAGSTTRYLCSAAKTLAVAAPVSLRVSPALLRNGEAMHFKGLLRGMKSARRSIVLQARARHARKWATIRVVRTDRGGRYRAKYRFTNTQSLVTYEFRSRVRRESGYPYHPGKSHVRHVTVVP